MSDPKKVPDELAQYAVKDGVPSELAQYAVKEPARAQPGFLDREIPLNSYTNATLSGIQSIGRGVRGAVQGILHPIESAKGILALPSQIAQVPAAIRDINASPDPLGTYADVAQQTAGQGAGQALVALGTEGLARGVPKVAKAPAQAAIRATAKGVNTALKEAPASIGAGIGGTIGYATRIPGAGKLGAIAGGIAGHELLPKITIPGERFGLAEPEYIPPRPSIERIPGAEDPFDKFRNQPVPPNAEYTPPRPSIGRLTNEIERTPLTKGEKVTPTTSKILSQELGQATNAPPPLVRGVPLKNQPAAQAAAASKGGLPEGFTPVESSVLKGYKYDPAKQEFTSVTKAGQRYTHAEVTPGEAKAFEQAESKGKAWNDLRNNHVQVQKNEMATKPIAPRSASPDDLTSLLEESVKQAKKK